MSAPPRRLRVVLKIGLTALILGAVVKVVGADQVTAAVGRLSVGSWFVVLAAFLATHAVATLKWRMFVGLAGAALPVATAYRAYAAGLFANLCLPSMVGGDVLRAGLAMQGSRRREAVVLGSIVDRLADFIGLALLATAGLLALPHALDQTGGSAADGRKALFVLAGVGLAGAVAIFIFWRARPPKTWPLKARLMMLRTALALRRMRSRKTAFTGAVLLSTTLQAALLLGAIHLGSGMGLGDVPFTVWAFAWPLAKIVAMLPISVGGLGVREAAFAGLCSRFGVEPASATALSLAWQSVLIAGGVLGGAYWAATAVRRSNARGSNGAEAAATARRAS